MTVKLSDVVPIAQGVFALGDRLLRLWSSQSAVVTPELIERIQARLAEIDADLSGLDASEQAELDKAVPVRIATELSMLGAAKAMAKKIDILGEEEK